MKVATKVFRVKKKNEERTNKPWQHLLFFYRYSVEKEKSH